MRAKSPWLMCHPFFVFAGWFDKKFIVERRTYLGIPPCAVIPPQICLFYEVYGRMRCCERLCAFPPWLGAAREHEEEQRRADKGYWRRCKWKRARCCGRDESITGAKEGELKPNGIIQFKGWLSVKVDKRVICVAFSECKYGDAPR